MNQVDHFMSKLMSNLDGSKDARIAVLATALEKAKQKLILYRHASTGEYIGGMEYAALIAEIDRALALTNGERG